MTRLRSIQPDWKVPAHVKAMVTLRPFNFATHVNDNADAVAINRQLLMKEFDLPSEPCWLNQTHSTDVIELPSTQILPAVDAAWTNQKATVCVVLTADCLPVFFYHSKQDAIAVVHAGWRGLAGGIIEKTINAMTSTPEHLQVWLGPAIGANEFEVGEDVKDIFCKDEQEASLCFKPSTKTLDKQHYLADIYCLAKKRLHNCGVNSISGGDFCTVSGAEQFFSYRRDGETGRMASLIWLSEY